MDNSYNINEELPYTFFIDIFEIKRDELYVMGHCTSQNIIAKANNKAITTKDLYFNRDSDKSNPINNYFIEFKIPLSQQGELKLEFESENGRKLNIDFSKQCNFSKIVGYAKSKKYLSILKGNEILIQKKTALKWIKHEIKAMFNMLKHPKRSSFIVIPFRLAYLIGYPIFEKQHIWFFMDRPNIADDSGLHLFRYAANKDKDIKKYFIASKDCPNYEEIRKIGDVIPFQSLKHRYLTLFAENIITTHPENPIIYPFWNSFPYYAGLIKSNTCFLQHGIIKDDISIWLNKSEMNLSMFVTSSPKEYESVLENNYNYDESVVKLVGLPRFDNLKNEEDKKEILIMPSWRNYLNNKPAEEIYESGLFKRFNSLINNEKLISYAKDHDYEIIFKPHPRIYKFLDLFDKNEYVKIASSDTEYQPLFNSGSILITDYSSVAFDFAYLKKPVVYYQYSEDYHFNLEDGYFKYDTMGFGEIVKDENELVDIIIDYIENKCQMKDEYIKRVDDFFLFTDKNNCKRVYEEIKKIPPKE